MKNCGVNHIHQTLLAGSGCKANVGWIWLVLFVISVYQTLCRIMQWLNRESMHVGGGPRWFYLRGGVTDVKEPLSARGCHKCCNIEVNDRQS